MLRKAKFSYEPLETVIKPSWEGIDWFCCNFWKYTVSTFILRKTTFYQNQRDFLGSWVSFITKYLRFANSEFIILERKYNFQDEVYKRNFLTSISIQPYQPKNKKKKKENLCPNFLLFLFLNCTSYWRGILKFKKINSRKE